MISEEKYLPCYTVLTDQFILIPPTNCLSVFDHFVGLMLKGFKDSDRHC